MQEKIQNQPDAPFVIRVPEQFRDSRLVLPTPDGWPLGKLLIIEIATDFPCTHDPQPFPQKRVKSFKK